MAMEIHSSDYETNKASNRFDQERLKYSVYPVYPAIAPPPILIDGFFEGSLIEKQAHHGTENNSTKGSRRTYIFCTLARTGC
jgi:hypothetical protein